MPSFRLERAHAVVNSRLPPVTANFGRSPCKLALWWCASLYLAACKKSIRRSGLAKRFLQLSVRMLDASARLDRDPPTRFQVLLPLSM